LARIVKLIWRGRLSPSLLVKMYLAERRRPMGSIGKHYPAVSNNAELIHLIRELNPERVLLFRAGLIVKRSVLSIGVPIMNVHCARIPEYGGIGSIQRALNDCAYEQCATLHQVTESIDQGVVHATEPYHLSSHEGYGWNEDRAYEAGIRLLKRVLA
jgi:methionyl-tRNA formyltransferase